MILRTVPFAWYDDDGCCCITAALAAGAAASAANTTAIAAARLRPNNFTCVLPFAVCQLHWRGETHRALSYPWPCESIRVLYSMSNSCDTIVSRPASHRPARARRELRGGRHAIVDVRGHERAGLVDVPLEPPGSLVAVAALDGLEHRPMLIREVAGRRVQMLVQRDHGLQQPGGPLKDRQQPGVAAELG